MGIKYGKKSDRICLANNEDAKIDFIDVSEDFIDFMPINIINHKVSRGTWVDIPRIKSNLKFA